MTTTETTTKGTRGVRCFEILGRGRPYGVQWRVAGKRKTEFYPTAALRDRRAAKLRKEKREGTVAEALTRDQVQEYRALKRVTHGIELSQLAALVDAHLRSLKPPGVLLKPACDEYLKLIVSQRDKKLIAPDTFRQKRGKVRTFCERFGELESTDITTDDLDTWLSETTKGVPSTFNNWRKVLRAFWEDAGLGKPNPFEAVKAREESTEEVSVLSVEETRTLFKAALKQGEPQFIARLAMEAFTGLRYGSVCRFAWEDFNFDDRGLVLPAAKLKTKRRHYLDDFPKNVWKWISLADKATWDVTQAKYMHWKSAVFTASGVRHPKNVLRHSFASHHVAAFKNPGLTARILCHRNQQMLYDHYLGQAKRADGLAYFQITPASLREHETGKPTDPVPVPNGSLPEPATPSECPPMTQS